MLSTEVNGCGGGMTKAVHHERAQVLCQPSITMKPVLELWIGEGIHWWVSRIIVTPDCKTAKCGVHYQQTEGWATGRTGRLELCGSHPGRGRRRIAAIKVCSLQFAIWAITSLTAQPGR